MTRAAFLSLFCLLVPALALSQPTGPYVSVHGGMSVGDGGGTAAAGGAVGYMLPRRLGFELEIDVTPSLDFGDLGFSDAFPTSLPIPAPTIDAKGRLLTFQVNLVANLSNANRLSVYVVGGGGAGNLETDVHYEFSQIVFPPVFPPLSPSTPTFIPPPEYVRVDRRISQSENALVLNAGGIVEYVWTGHVALGVDARYTHGFFKREALENGRVAARMTWRF